MTDNNRQDSPAATVEDIALHFGVSERTVRRWLTETDIPHFRVGGIIRFRVDEVAEWMRATKPEPAETGAS
jgi:excisionase family DNA binding protein